MSKKCFFVLCFVIVFMLTACGKKEEKVPAENKKEEIENKATAENYTGECGYITDNQVYDYSNMFDKIYDWGDGIKMPFEKMEKAEIGWQDVDYPSYSSMYFSNVTREEMKNYVTGLENEGFFVYEQSNSYMLYKENFRVGFSYNEYKDRYVIFCYAGNVIKDREVTAEDARKIIENNGLLDENEIFDEYYVFSIESETVKLHGYYEFFIEPTKSKGTDWEKSRPFYLITDGKDVLLFEQNILSDILPTNVNIIEKDGKTELITSTIIMDETYNNYVAGYELVDNRFVKVWEYDWRNYMDIIPEKEIIISKVDNGDLKFYILSPIENYNHKNGRKDYWKIKEEYSIKKTLIGQ